MAREEGLPLVPPRPVQRGAAVVEAVPAASVVEVALAEGGVVLAAAVWVGASWPGDAAAGVGVDVRVGRGGGCGGGGVGWGWGRDVGEFGFGERGQ